MAMRYNRRKSVSSATLIKMTQKKPNTPSKKKMALPALFDACKKRGNFAN